MFKLYVRSQKAQWRWIRKHPVQYVILNVVVGVAGYFFIKRQEEKCC